MVENKEGINQGMIKVQKRKCKKLAFYVLTFEQFFVGQRIYKWNTSIK